MSDDPDSVLDDLENKEGTALPELDIEKPWTYHDEVSTPGRTAEIKAKKAGIWLVPDILETLGVGYEPDYAEVFRFAFRMSRPTICAGGEETFWDYLGKSVEIYDQNFFIIAIDGLHVGPERQTIADVYAATREIWAGFGGIETLSLMKWPSPKLVNMQMAYPPAATTERRDGTVIARVGKPFLPDPYLVGQKVAVKTTPIHASLTEDWDD